MEEKLEPQPDSKADVLEKLNADEFVPQAFVSTKKPATNQTGGNIVIDLASQTIKVPKAEGEQAEDPLFHPNFFGNDDERMTRWIRKLMFMRQNA